MSPNFSQYQLSKLRQRKTVISALRSCKWWEFRENAAWLPFRTSGILRAGKTLMLNATEKGVTSAERAISIGRILGFDAGFDGHPGIARLSESRRPTSERLHLMEHA
jgi:hypothetical protein